MTDMRGLYKPLAKAEEQEVPKEYWGCDNGNFTFTSSRPSRLCSRIPVLLVGAAIALTGLMLIGLHHSHYVAGSGRNSEELAAPYRRHLSSPLHAHKVVHSPASIAYVVGEHHPVSGDFPADYQWVDPDSREPFDEVMTTNGMNNNAMARMPVGSPYDMMVVGRGWSDKYIDPTEHIHYVNLTLVGFFVNYEPISGSWIRAGPEPYILDIPIWRQFPRPCRNLVNGGPADPRLIWSDAGEPLAIIGTSSQVPGVCKAVGLADLRAVWPGLKQHLADIGYGDIPIRLKQFTELGKAGGQAPYEKNWAAFFSGPSPPKSISNTILASKRWIGTNFQRGPSLWPYFLTQMKNHSVVAVNENQLTGGRSTGSYVMAESLNLTVTNKANETYEASSACIFNSLPLNWDPDRMHLATPFYRVTFCRRDACEPSRENTVLLGLIHYKKSPQSYMRMFVTMKVDAPFEIISVSPPLHFGAPEMDSDVVFSVSMAFLPSKRSYSIGEHPFKPSKDRAGGWLAHGWLDDTIVVGVGLRDAAYDAVHIPVATALQGHTLCS